MIKKGDTVMILTGSHKGAKGAVERVIRAEDKLIVAGVNIKKHIVKARTRGEKHTVVEKAYPIHLSNVALIDSSTGKPTRVGVRVEGKKKTRIARKSGKDIA